MSKKGLFCLLCAVSILTGLIVVRTGQAGSESLKAEKRTIYQDDSGESMRDVYVRRETEDKEYKQKILSNSEESVILLKEIRDLLQQLNAREKKEAI